MRQRQSRSRPISSRLLVDGSNVLGRAAGYRLGAAADREALLRRLRDYGHGHPGQRIVVWLDGKRSERRKASGLEVRFSDARGADDGIVRMLDRLTPAERRQARLVTDDRELARRARERSARVESVSWLMSALPEPQEGESERGVSAAEAEELRAHFLRPKE